MGKIIKFKTKEEVRIMVEMKKYNDLQQFAKTVMYFVNNSSTALYKTKLNKLLFYAQFLMYKTYGTVFFDGVNFIKDHYGPVMEGLDFYLEALEKNNFIKIRYNEYGQIIDAMGNLAQDVYSENELKILDKISSKFDSYTSRGISLYSHAESLWRNTPPKQIIDLRRANELNGFN